VLASGSAGAVPFQLLTRAPFDIRGGPGGTWAWYDVLVEDRPAVLRVHLRSWSRPALALEPTAGADRPPMVADQVARPPS
jgi:hypothetical protein